MCFLRDPHKSWCSSWFPCNTHNKKVVPAPKTTDGPQHYRSIEDGPNSCSGRLLGVCPILRRIWVCVCVCVEAGDPQTVAFCVISLFWQPSNRVPTLNRPAILFCVKGRHQKRISVFDVSISTTKQHFTEPQTSHILGPTNGSIGKKQANKQKNEALHHHVLPGGRHHRDPRAVPSELRKARGIGNIRWCRNRGGRMLQMDIRFFFFSGGGGGGIFPSAEIGRIQGQLPDLLPARQDADGRLQGGGPSGASAEEERATWKPWSRSRFVSSKTSLLFFSNGYLPPPPAFLVCFKGKPKKSVSSRTSFDRIDFPPFPPLLVCFEGKPPIFPLFGLL